MLLAFPPLPMKKRETGLKLTISLSLW